MTPVLLALVMTAAADLRSGRPQRAGAWIGVATAAKGFPALLLIYLVYRRWWRGAVIGSALAAGLTVGAMLPLGPLGAVSAVRDWLGLSLRGDVLGHLRTQSVAGLSSLLGWPRAAVLVVALACLGGVLVALGRPAGREGSLLEVGMTTLLAILLSPIAWLYYFTLAFPGWLALLSRPAPRPARSRFRIALLIATGLLTSGVLTFDLYPQALWFIRDVNYTWGGVLLLALLASERGDRPLPDPQSA